MYVFGELFVNRAPGHFYDLFVNHIHVLQVGTKWFFFYTGFLGGGGGGG